MSRRLPYIIGSENFTNYDHLGLVDTSSEDEEEDGDDENESEEEIVKPSPPTPQPVNVEINRSAKTHVSSNLAGKILSIILKMLFINKKYIVTSSLNLHRIFSKYFFKKFPTSSQFQNICRLNFNFSKNFVKRP